MEKNNFGFDLAYLERVRGHTRSDGSSISDKDGFVTVLATGANLVRAPPVGFVWGFFWSHRGNFEAR